MEIQSDKEVAQELLKSLKEDTSKVSSLVANELYSLQMGEGGSLMADTTFKGMKLKEELLEALYSLKYEKPSLIQNIAIPRIMLKSSFAFQSKSGTGKTMAFTIGALQLVEKGVKQQVVILSPTRELSKQVGLVVQKLATPLGIKVCFALGDYTGKSIEEEIVVGCPGKIINLFNSNVLNAELFKMIIFDEADELISNQAFTAQTLKLLRTLTNAQRIFFSATYSELSQKAIKNVSPNTKTLFEKNEKADKIQLYYLEVKSDKKITALISLMEYLTIAQTVIFVSTKHMVDSLAKEMIKDGHSVSKIHGSLTNAERDAANDDFTSAKTKILITTNVYSRGMDIPQVNLIINYDIPNFSSEDDKQTYIHRIGRSGRFNRSGFVIDFVSNEDDLKLLGFIQSSMGAVSKKFTLDALFQAFTDSTDL